MYKSLIWAIHMAVQILCSLLEMLGAECDTKTCEGLP